jgi:hypothetical protein
MTTFTDGISGKGGERGQEFAHQGHGEGVARMGPVEVGGACWSCGWCSSMGSFCALWFWALCVWGAFSVTGWLLGIAGLYDGEGKNRCPSRDVVT